MRHGTHMNESWHTDNEDDEDDENDEHLFASERLRHLEERVEIAPSCTSGGVQVCGLCLRVCVHVCVHHVPVRARMRVRVRVRVRACVCVCVCVRALARARSLVRPPARSLALSLSPALYLSCSLFLMHMIICGREWVAGVGCVAARLCGISGWGRLWGVAASAWSSHRRERKQ